MSNLLDSSRGEKEKIEDTLHIVKAQNAKMEDKL